LRFLLAAAGHLRYLTDKLNRGAATLNPSIELLDRAFFALADPTRRALLERLADGPATVGELAEPFEISLPAISKHLTVLERARLIRREPDAQRRRCTLEPEGLRPALLWMERAEAFWTGSFDNLAEYLSQEQEEASHGASRNARKKPKRRRKGEG
jgi:DNA-binding transcriptional ArsR family regulator